jgi:hypothetical protein
MISLNLLCDCFETFLHRRAPKPWNEISLLIICFIKAQTCLYKPNCGCSKFFFRLKDGVAVNTHPAVLFCVFRLRHPTVAQRTQVAASLVDFCKSQIIGIQNKIWADIRVELWHLTSEWLAAMYVHQLRIHQVTWGQVRRSSPLSRRRKDSEGAGSFCASKYMYTQMLPSMRSVAFKYFLLHKILLKITGYLQFKSLKHSGYYTCHQI